MPTVLDPLDQLGLGGLATGKIYLVYGKSGVGKSLFLLLSSLSFANKGMQVLYLMPESVDIRLFPSRIGNEYGLRDEVYRRLKFVVPEGVHPEEKIITTVEETKPSLLVYHRVNVLYSVYAGGLSVFSSHYGQLFAQFLVRIRNFSTRVGVATILSVESNSGRKPAGFAHLKYFSDYLVEFGTSVNHRWVAFTDANRTQRRFYTIDNFEFQVIRPA